jgi:hypothetical protein
MYYTQTLDGDIACNMVPANDVQPILDNPLGIETILNNQTYANPNRFFCHWMYKGYLVSTPLYLQHYVRPIESVYLSTAFAKTGIQIALILLLAIAISGTTNIFKLSFMSAAVLVTPFFQTNGFRDVIGIIDCSITYTFFYALPCVFVVLYFLPMLREFFNGYKLKYPVLMKILWILLAFVVCLSGPLNPGIVLVIAVLLAYYFLKNGLQKSDRPGLFNKLMDAIAAVPKNYWFYMIPVCVLSAYSLFLGQYNSLTIESRIPLMEMYSRLPIGIYNTLTQKLAYPVLIGMIILNSVLISSRFNSDEGSKILRMTRWIVAFSVFYILLLPLGGYREYRHYIVRYDTIMPVTLALIFVYGVSSFYLVKQMASFKKLLYLAALVVVGLIYNTADKHWGDINACERQALEEIAASKENVVELKQDCTVVGWYKIEAPEYSELNARLLVIWGITKEKKLYYQK